MMHGRKTVEMRRLSARTDLSETAAIDKDEPVSAQSQGYDPYNSSGQFLLLESEAVETAAP